MFMMLSWETPGKQESTSLALKISIFMVLISTAEQFRQCTMTSEVKTKLFKIQFKF